MTKLKTQNPQVQKETYVRIKRMENTVMQVDIENMELEMKKHALSKKYRKWLLKQMFVSAIIADTRPAFRWIHWLEYFFMKKKVLRSVSKKMTKPEQDVRQDADSGG